MGADFLHDGLSRDARNRQFTGRIDVENEDRIGEGKRLTEFLPQQLGAGVAVRLEDTDHAPLGKLPGCLKGGRDFGRMMAVVVHHRVGRMAQLHLKPPPRPPEGAQCRGNPVKWHAQLRGQRCHRQGVQHVVPSGNIQDDPAQRLPFPADREGGALPRGFQVLRRIVVRRVPSITDHPFPSLTNRLRPGIRCTIK